MEPVAQYYSVYPSIVKVGATSKMTIAPIERVYLLVENCEYSVSIMGVNFDEPDYHTPLNRKTFTCVAHNGVVEFDYTFDQEQEYRIYLSKDEKLLAKLCLYALNDDLYALKPLRGDLHTHSHRSDGLCDPSSLSGHFREQGYDFFALTDHNRYFSGGEIDEVFASVNTRLTRVSGEEIHFPGNTVHIVHVGGKHSVAIKYIKNLEECEKEVAKIEVPDFVPDHYKLRYAKCKWACDKIHEAGGLAIFAHPYWVTGANVYNVEDVFTNILLKSGMFDAFELVGGMQTCGINIAVALYTKLAVEGYPLNVVGSSDVHNVKKSTFNNLFTIAFAKSNTASDILDAVKNGFSVAVEGSGYAYEREYRAYGKHRLVMYAQFLLKNYFPLRQRLCASEGVFMRSFAVEQSGKEVIEAIAKETKAFEDKFFGVVAPTPYSKQMMEFEDKWRAVQIADGPNSKGSSINVKVPTFQI